MTVPEPVFYPPFDITRASHTRLGVRDLATSKEFYTRVIGLVVTEEDDDEVYLRGVEEICHHSLVLRRTTDEPMCEQIGMRVLTDDELDKAHAHFTALGLQPDWVELRGQGRTLRVTDAIGVPLEFCASMTRVPRMKLAFEAHIAGTPLRFDHYQLHVSDLDAAWRFYTSLGFRTSDYIVTASAEDAPVLAICVHRNDIPWDFVILQSEGPRMHHFGYVSPSPQEMYRAAELAGEHGYGSNVEYGPGTHAFGHGRFVYFRDPDGHRVELYLDPTHQMNDLESEPRRLDMSTAPLWGLPPQRSWVVEASRFPGQETRMPAIAAGPGHADHTAA